MREAAVIERQRIRRRGGSLSLLCSLSIAAASSLVFCNTQPDATDVSCAREPEPALVAFLEGAPQPLPDAPFSPPLEVVFVRATPENDLGLRKLIFKDLKDQSEHSITLGGGPGSLPLTAGANYRLHIEHRGGFPPASGFWVEDEEGIVAAGASDWDVARLVLKEGIPSFELALLPASCPSRTSDRCFDAVQNRALRISYRGESIELFQGESAELGPYRIRCLIAQQVTYSDRCCDAGVPGVSYWIVRR